MKPHLAALVSGAAFTAGLAISGMTLPAKVLGFLDFFGSWDPTLAFVMAGALALYVPAYQLAKRRSAPTFEPAFDLPKQTAITWQLLVGAVVFGAGWGLAGLCPAAAVAALPALSSNAVAVTVGMVVGIVGMRWARHKRAVAEPEVIADF